MTIRPKQLFYSALTTMGITIGQVDPAMGYIEKGVPSYSPSFVNTEICETVGVSKDAKSLLEKGRDFFGEGTEQILTAGDDYRVITEICATGNNINNANVSLRNMVFFCDSTHRPVNGLKIGGEEIGYVVIEQETDNDNGFTSNVFRGLAEKSDGNYKVLEQFCGIKPDKNGKLNLHNRFPNIQNIQPWELTLQFFYYFDYVSSFI